MMRTFRCRMRSVHIGSRTLVVALLLASSGCGWLFHKPRPDADLPPSERPWRVRCTWVVESAKPVKAPETGWLWAADAEDRRLVVGGALEDGFLRADTLRAASDEDDRDVVAMEASARVVAEACAGTLTRLLRHGRATLALQDRCYTAGLLGTSDPGEICADAGRAFFWDSVHPTSHTHCWIAYFIARAMAREGWLERVPSPEEQRAYCNGES